MIKRFLKEECLGYSNNLQTSYFKHTVKMLDGTIEILYSTQIRQQDGIITKSKKTKVQPSPPIGPLGKMRLRRK